MRQWLDGFNAGWIEFDREGAAARKGTITIDQAIAALVGKEAADGACHKIKLQQPTLSTVSRTSAGR